MLLSRLALNMQTRVIYPFLPAISRGLGVPLQTTSLLLTARTVGRLISSLVAVRLWTAGATWQTALNLILPRRPMWPAGLRIKACRLVLGIPIPWKGGQALVNMSAPLQSWDDAVVEQFLASIQ